MKKKSKFHNLLNLKKKTLTGLFLFFTCFITTAQITGKAINEQKEPVAFATVILKTAQDSSIVAFTTYEIKIKLE